VCDSGRLVLLGRKNVQHALSANGSGRRRDEGASSVTSKLSLSSNQQLVLFISPPDLRHLASALCLSSQRESALRKCLHLRSKVCTLVSFKLASLGGCAIWSAAIVTRCLQPPYPESSRARRFASWVTARLPSSTSGTKNQNRLACCTETCRPL
jgi:hypothetical protein